MKYVVRAAMLSALAILLASLALAQAPSGTRPSTTYTLANSVHGGPTPGTAVPDRTATRPKQKGNGQDPYATTLAYVTTFYPRWFTHIQSSFAACNQLVGPDHISPIYHVVVAINDDTLYVTTFVCLQDQPAIVTVPATKDNYSVLQLDGFGDIFAGIPNLQPGVYGLTPPGWVGDLPPEVIRIPVPYTVSELIFRADKFSPSGQDMTEEAELFRRSLHVASLSDYETDHNAGAAEIVPEADFAAPLKQTADQLVANDAITFLTQLQTAVLDPSTQPLTPSEQTLSNNFNTLFLNHSLDPDFIAGAQAAHAALDADYLTHFLVRNNLDHLHQHWILGHHPPGISGPVGNRRVPAIWEQSLHRGILPDVSGRPRSTPRWQHERLHPDVPGRGHSRRRTASGRSRRTCPTPSNWCRTMRTNMSWEAILLAW